MNKITTEDIKRIINSVINKRFYEIRENRKIADRTYSQLIDELSTYRNHIDEAVGIYYGANLEELVYSEEYGKILYYVQDLWEEFKRKYDNKSSEYYEGVHSKDDYERHSYKRKLEDLEWYFSTIRRNKEELESEISICKNKEYSLQLPKVDGEKLFEDICYELEIDEKNINFQIIILLEEVGKNYIRDNEIEYYSLISYLSSYICCKIKETDVTLEDCEENMQIINADLESEYEDYITNSENEEQEVNQSIFEDAKNSYYNMLNKFISSLTIENTNDRVFDFIRRNGLENSLKDEKLKEKYNSYLKELKTQELISSQKKTISEKEEEISKKNSIIEEKERLIQEKEKLLKEKDSLIENKEKEHQTEIQNKDEKIKSQDSIIGSYEEERLNNEKESRKKDLDLLEQTAINGSLFISLAKKTNEQEKMELQYNSELDEKDRMLLESQKIIQALQERIEEMKHSFNGILNEVKSAEVTARKSVEEYKENKENQKGLGGLFSKKNDVETLDSIINNIYNIDDSISRGNALLNGQNYSSDLRTLNIQRTQQIYSNNGLVEENSNTKLR